MFSVVTPLGRVVDRAADGCVHLSGADGALQRRFFPGQVGVGVAQPGQGGAVWIEMRLLMGRVEEPALSQHQRAVREV